MLENKVCNGCMEPIQGEGICPHCGYNPDNSSDNPLYINPGTILMGYQFGRVLGHGGFGITYLGYDFNGGRKVAIKEFMPTDLATRRSDNLELSIFTGEKQLNFNIQLEKFKKEVELLKTFKGFPGIVEAYDLFEANRTAYFVMEYVDGITLKEYVDQKGGRINFETVRAILLPVMDALAEMHRQHIIHRDISPDNIFITTTKQVKLLDFGAARVALQNQDKGLSVILKHGFTPKEQYFTNGNQGPWTDIYALAATAYYLMTGNVPQPALDRLEIDRLVPISSYVSDLNPVVDGIFKKALSIDETKRYQSIKDFKDALINLPEHGNLQVTPYQTTPLAQQPITVMPMEPKKKSKKGFIAILAVLVFVLLLGAGGVFLFMPKIPDLTGEIEEEALSILDDLGYSKKDYDITYEFSKKVKRGEVIEQSPEGGQKTLKKYVELIISEGPEEFELEDIVGQTEDDAVTLLEEVGLKVKVNRVFDEVIPKGTVISSDPTPGTTIRAKDIITLAISEGPNPDAVYIPDVHFKKAIIDALELYNVDPETGIILKEMVEDVTDLFIGYWDIEDLEGIEAFTSLEALSVSGNKLKELPVLPESIEYLYVADNKLTSLDVSNLENLYSLDAGGNELTEFPKLPPYISDIDISDNSIVDISNVKDFTDLTSLDISNNLVKDMSVLNEIAAQFYYLVTDGNPGVFTGYNNGEWVDTVYAGGYENTIIPEYYETDNTAYLSLLTSTKTEDLEAIPDVVSSYDFDTTHGIVNLFTVEDEGAYYDYFMDIASGSCRYFDIYGSGANVLMDGTLQCEVSSYKDITNEFYTPTAITKYDDSVRIDYVTADCVYAFFCELDGTLWYLRVINLDHYYDRWPE